MYSTFDCNEILYVALKDALIDNVQTGYIGINGGIYYDDERPNNSTKEDVTINTPSISGNQIQQGYSNINIYVPTMKITTAKGGQRVKNRDRERQLIKLVVNAIDNLHNRYGLNYVQSQNDEQSPDGEETFCNIRIFWKLLNH